MCCVPEASPALAAVIDKSCTSLQTFASSSRDAKLTEKTRILHLRWSQQLFPKHATQRHAPERIQVLRCSTSALPIGASPQLSWERDPFCLPVRLSDRVQQLEARGAAPHRPPLPGPGGQLPIGRRLERAICRMARQVGVDVLKGLARIRLSRLSRLGLRLLRLLRLLGLLPRIFSVLG